MGESNYEKLFGSPEKVAITFAAIEEWLRQEVMLSKPPEEGNEWFAPGPYYLLSETVGADFKCNALSLLEWLRGDAE